MKEIINFEGKDQKVVTFEEFEKIINQIGLNWFGIKNWSRGDLDLFEEKLDGVTCEPVNGGMKLWNRNFDYSHLEESYDYKRGEDGAFNIPAQKAVAYDSEGKTLVSKL